MFFFHALGSMTLKTSEHQSIHNTMFMSTVIDRFNHILHWRGHRQTFRYKMARQSVVKIRNFYNFWRGEAVSIREDQPEGQQSQFTQWVGDKVDHNICTLAGKATFHGMAIIFVSKQSRGSLLNLSAKSPNSLYHNLRYKEFGGFADLKCANNTL